MTTGTVENIVPFGSTIATEEYWDDSFIEEALSFFNLPSDEFDDLGSREQDIILKNYAKHLEERYLI